MSNENKVAIGQDGDRKKPEHQYSTIPPANCQILADILLNKIDPTYADDWEICLRILVAYRNSGGAIEHFIDWSHAAHSDVSKKIKRAWYNCQFGAGLWTLVFYVKISGNLNIVQALRRQHYEQMFSHAATAKPGDKI